MDAVSESLACRRCRELLGPVLLGQPTDQGERQWLQDHLSGCSECQQEYDELLPVVALLPRVDLAHLAQPSAAPPPSLKARVLHAVHGERRRRRVRLVLAAAASVILLVVGGFAALSPRGDDSLRRELASVGGAAAAGDATLEARARSTTMRLELAGLTPGTTYGAWLERADGSRVVAGTFKPADDRIAITLSVSIPLREGSAVGVSSVDAGKDVLRAELRSG